MLAKRYQVEDSNDRPRKRVKGSGDLIFTISAVYIGRRGDKNGVEYDIVPILPAFPE
ncbi:hypothetical protein F4824DRAFT_453011 [Ustulina deusta]|nr:hypothetical protein F4824DRAFT_453011 [Ustulina deusta]